MKEFLRTLLAPPHPTFRSRKSKAEGNLFVRKVLAELPQATIVNLGSACVRLHPQVINLDLFVGKEVDIQGNLLALPFVDASLDAIVCNGVLEHVENPYLAIEEMKRVLKQGGEAYIEIPWMQGVHASPRDFQRWTPEGLHCLFSGMDILWIRVSSGPASALAWMFQETLAMLFSFGSSFLYKVGLRIFGWLAIPLSWFDIFLERNPQAWRIASGYMLLVKKP